MEPNSFSDYELENTSLRRASHASISRQVTLPPLNLPALSFHIPSAPFWTGFGPESGHCPSTLLLMSLTPLLPQLPPPPHLQLPLNLPGPRRLSDLAVVLVAFLGPHPDQEFSTIISKIRSGMRDEGGGGEGALQSANLFSGRHHTQDLEQLLN